MAVLSAHPSTKIRQLLERLLEPSFTFGNEVYWNRLLSGLRPPNINANYWFEWLLTQAVPSWKAAGCAPSASLASFVLNVSSQLVGNWQLPQPAIVHLTKLLDVALQWDGGGGGDSGKSAPTASLILGRIRLLQNCLALAGAVDWVLQHPHCVHEAVEVLVQRKFIYLGRDSAELLAQLVVHVPEMVCKEFMLKAGGWRKPNILDGVTRVQCAVRRKALPAECWTNLLKTEHDADEQLRTMSLARIHAVTGGVSPSEQLNASKMWLLLQPNATRMLEIFQQIALAQMKGLKDAYVNLCSLAAFTLPFIDTEDGAGKSAMAAFRIRLISFQLAPIVSLCKVESLRSPADDNHSPHLNAEFMDQWRRHLRKADAGMAVSALQQVTEGRKLLTSSEQQFVFRQICACLQSVCTSGGNDFLVGLDFVLLALFDGFIKYVNLEHDIEPILAKQMAYFLRHSIWPIRVVLMTLTAIKCIVESAPSRTNFEGMQLMRELLMSKLCDRTWELRDGTLELIDKWLERFPQAFLPTHEDSESVAAVLMGISEHDSDTYARVSAMCCLRHFNNAKNALHLMEHMRTDTHSTVRTECVRSLTYLAKTHLDRPIHRHMDLCTAIYQASQDSYWDVKVGSLNFWLVMINEMLDAQRHLSSDDLSILQRIGCLNAATECLKDCDMEVLKAAVQLLTVLRDATTTLCPESMEVVTDEDDDGGGGVGDDDNNTGNRHNTAAIDTPTNAMDASTSNGITENGSRGGCGGDDDVGGGGNIRHDSIVNSIVNSRDSALLRHVCRAEPMDVTHKTADVKSTALEPISMQKFWQLFRSGGPLDMAVNKVAWTNSLDDLDSLLDDVLADYDASLKQQTNTEPNAEQLDGKNALDCY